MNQPPSRWETIESKVSASYPVFKIVERRCRHPKNGIEAQIYTADGFDWALAVARTPEGKFLFVNQYRFGIDDFSWEFPAGCLEPGEDPVDGAARELREETGYTAKAPVLIGTCHPNPALQNNTCHIVYFEDAYPAEGGHQWDEMEEMELRLLEMDDIEAMISEGQAHHAILFAALYYYNRHKKSPGN